MLEKNNKKQLITTKLPIEMVAALEIAGHSPQSIARELKTTRFKVKRVMQQPEYKAHKDSLIDAVNKEAVKHFKYELAKLTPSLIDLMRRLIEAGNPKALDVYLKTIGIEKETVQAQNSSITVVLPNLEQTTIEVPSE